MKIYSEKFALKYLLSNKGVCLGVDTKKCSYLFLITQKGVLFRKRPVGDKVVENLEYEIEKIYDAIVSEDALSVKGKV